MHFSDDLLSWYAENKRDLPWRRTKNPYHIWISEIILQQTRVEQGLPYYLKFIKKYPQVKDLAIAKEDDVLKLWQGLGYYTRARNLHHAAKYIHTVFDGIFPSDYSTIISLKGIGKYTAAAIASLAFNQTYPVVDGNVQRVLARVFGIDDITSTKAAEKKFYAIAEKLINRDKPGIFNQALMEFGAVCCIPMNPICINCIFSHRCIAYKTGRVGELPAKIKKKKCTERYFNYCVIQKGSKIFINKRKGDDIWKNLYEFPLIEVKGNLSIKELWNSDEWKFFFSKNSFKCRSVTGNFRHVLSHQIINATFWEISLNNWSAFKKSNKFIEIQMDELPEFPVSRLIEKYLESRKKKFCRRSER